MASDEPHAPQAQLIPPIGVIPQAERMFRVNWVANLERSPSGVPLHAPEYVSHQGRGVRLIDVREADELTGPLGYIPGSDWIPRERAPSLVDRLPPLTPVILISRGGERSSDLADLLEKAGMRMVASMRGGMIAWRALGYASTRDTSILARKDVLSEAPVAKKREPGPLTAAEIAEHVGDPRSTRWIKLAAILLHGRQSCVDGRDDSTIIGTPGGDGGELVLGLTALERLTGHTFDAEQITELFHRRIDTFGRFYIHTDIHAANAIIVSMRADPRLTAAIGSTFEPLEWRKWWRSPPSNVRSIVADHACNPAHMGCGHLRLMVQKPEEYGVRRELVLGMLRSFFATRWAGSEELELPPLPGGHEEGAVVNVRIDAELHPYTSIPLVSPSCAGTQMFVNHPQVSTYLRRELAAFLCEQYDLFDARPDPEELTAAIEELAARQLGTTLGYLAAGLRIFDLVFDCDDKVRIDEVGRVPARESA